MHADSNQRLILFDTTLRDGEQAPGFNMNLDEKLQVASALGRLGVDVIEAGFPAASPGDFESVRAVAEAVRGPVICGLARCHQADIEAVHRSLEGAERSRIHVFLATSPIHREHKLQMGTDEVLRRIESGVSLARSLCEDVEFSAEDASRTEPEFLARAVQVAIEAGAGTINIPDTVGYAIPSEFGEIFRMLNDVVPGVESIVLSSHCHDDLGLAVANSLAALGNGARQVECTINGIGERAGNCALEEVAMAVRTRQDEFGLEIGIDTTRLQSTSRLLSSITGVPVPPNKAIVGANAFAHEAGIHQHGVLAHSSTYEIMRPDDVGFSGEQLVLGKHSGRHAMRHKIEELGYALDEDSFEEVFVGFKKLADRKKTVLDADIEALIVGTGIATHGPWELISLHTSAGTGSLPTASVEVAHRDDAGKAEAAVGDGPIDATFKALARATGYLDTSLTDYQVRSVTFGEDAQGQVTVHCEHEGRTVRGVGVSTDVIEASALAFLDVINRCENDRAQSDSVAPAGADQ